VEGVVVVVAGCEAAAWPSALTMSSGVRFGLSFQCSSESASSVFGEEDAGAGEVLECGWFAAVGGCVFDGGDERAEQRPADGAVVPGVDGDLVRVAGVGVLCPAGRDQPACVREQSRDSAHR
jgi:hypothetical protein